VAVADLNGDKRPDLVIEASLFFNQGNDFGPRAMGFTMGMSTGFPAVGDFNQDGLPDLAFGEPLQLPSDRGHVWIVLNQGQGRFSGLPLRLTAEKAMTGPLAVRDFDGDGQMDIAAINPGGSAVEVYYLDKKPSHLAVSRRAALGDLPVGLDAGDLNGDGRMDLALSVTIDRRLVLLLNQGGRDQWTRVDHPLPEQSNCVALGDLNGDGRADVVAGQGNRLALFHNAGGGVLVLRQFVPLDMVPQSLVLRDFDGDQRMDIAVDCSKHLGPMGPSSYAVIVLLNQTP
jgi:hypothetical protein